MNKENLFEIIKVILYCSLIGIIVFSLLSNIFKSIFTGVFVFLFYFSYKNIFTFKNKNDKKFSTITTFSLGLLAISTVIAGVITGWIEK